MAAWCTEQEVNEFTGATVTPVQLALAQSTVELHVGRTSEAQVRPADLKWLKRAVAFQAVWLTTQPDLLTRTEVDSSSQDGASARYSGGEDQVLAPLAKRALRRLSWRGSRSVTMDGSGIMSRRDYVAGLDGVMAIYDYPFDRWSKL